jgi:YD repeat-containing protein
VTVKGDALRAQRARPHPAGNAGLGHGGQQEQSVNQEFSRTGQVTYAGRPTKNGATPVNYSLNSYDQAGRVRIATDAEGRQVRFTYDMGGRVVREERQNANNVFETWKTVQYEPNSSNIASITDGKGNTTTYEYNGFGRLAKTTYPDQTFEYFGYDPNGNLTVHWTRAGQRIDMWYDTRNRLVWREQTSGAEGPTYLKPRIRSFDYDSVGNVRLALTQENGFYPACTVNEYGGLNRMRREWQGWGLEGVRPQCWTDYKSVSYDYADAQGNERSRPTKIAWPDGFHVFYDLDALDRVTAIRLCSSGHAQCTGATLVTYTYDELGRRIQSRTHNNAGVLTRYRWETDNDLAAVAHDAANDGVGDVVFAAAFNRAGEPTAEDITNTAYVWPSALTATATVGNTNAITSWTIEGQGGETLLYDANGNLSSWRNRTYVHDTDNQLREVWQGAGRAWERDADRAIRIRRAGAAGAQDDLFADDDAHVLPLCGRRRDRRVRFRQQSDPPLHSGADRGDRGDDRGIDDHLSAHGPNGIGRGDVEFGGPDPRALQDFRVGRAECWSDGGSVPFHRRALRPGERALLHAGAVLFGGIGEVHRDGSGGVCAADESLRV